MKRWPKKLKFSKRPLVLVEWVDSAYSIGWHWMDGAPSIKKCQSVGWVSGKSRDAITITANLTIEETPQRCCDITIPIRAVTQIHLL